MAKSITKVDICCGLAWGDEAKGKIVAHLASKNKYDFICRWAGGNNAGHTIYINKQKYHTHLIPSGVFYGVKSIIGPDCVVHIGDFLKEIKYLKDNDFDTTLVKISPKAHIVTDEHKTEDKHKYLNVFGTTGKGIAPCYRDKYARKGKQASQFLPLLKEYMWNEELYGNILCEGAQGFWLDINYGNYPYVTSSNTLPYGACSLGFAPQYIKTIYGAAKIYDTRVGLDTGFPESLLTDKELKQIATAGEEYGVTTGRPRKANWLNVDKLIKAVNISGTTKLVISKVDVLEKVQLFRFIYHNTIKKCDTLEAMKQELIQILMGECKFLSDIIFSDNPYGI